MYKRAAVEKREFELVGAELTTCDRPFARRGEPIIELLKANASELIYNERLDTTTSSRPTEATTREGFLPENATIDWNAVVFAHIFKFRKFQLKIR